MSVNPSPSSSIDLHAQVAAILATLQLPTDDTGLRQRIRTFIICNGFLGVYIAAQGTAKQLNSKHAEAIKDPWPYTIRLYNQDLARSSYLYTLTHWVEGGLRSQLDIRYKKAIGVTWHQDPSKYLESRHILRFEQTSDQQLAWQPQTPPLNSLVIGPQTPEEFLQRISFRWLAHMVLHLHRRNNRLILMGRDGSVVDPRKADSMLTRAVDIRNDIAHNRPISNEVFMKEEENLVELLKLLRFDVLKALQKSEMERETLVRAAMRRLGMPST